MCTEQLPPGGYPIAVKYIISYILERAAVSVLVLNLNNQSQIDTAISQKSLIFFNKTVKTSNHA
jgi:hypothetical protein